jgi:glycosidase
MKKIIKRLRKSPSLILAILLIVPIFGEVILPSSTVAAEEVLNSSVNSEDSTDLTNKPFTWDNANIYFVLTDRFYNGDQSNDHSYGRPQRDAWDTNIGTFHGGDIKGLIEKLEEGYFTALGTNAIWISAPWEQMHGWVGGKDGDFAHYGYHGYYGLDFTSMDKNMGTVDEMREFVDLAHSMGIRVVLDVIMNHVAYPTIVDMHEFSYGDTGGLSRDWTPNRHQGQDWHTHNEIMNKNNAAAWSNWWGRDWIRADETAGYDNCGSGEINMCVGFLPDIKTETTTSVNLPPLLKNKWNKEANDFDDWIVPAAKQYRQELNIAPKDYMVKWLSSWVEEFGIDGFRVDTAKHVEIDRWGQLDNESNAALQKWRQNNPDKPGAHWDDDFWMTAEVFGHGLGKSEYFDHGFDSVINFDFQGANKNDLEGLFSRYAHTINNDPEFNMLSYISSHDTSLYSREDLIQAGTALLLLPGGIQTFYGDETARPLGDGGSDPEQGTRSSMNWNHVNQNVLSHWQKLGQFRNNHLSIGAGDHRKLADRPYTFARTYESDEITDEVVIATEAQGITAVTVAGIFADGEVVRDAYTGAEATVSDGKATFSAGSQGVILIENTAEPITNLPVISASPGDRTFKTEELTITLNIDKAETGKYTLDGSNPENGITFTDGTEITIGADLEYEESVILKIYGENENGTRTRSYTYKKRDPNALLEVYFKKPADWSTPQLYYYEASPKEPEVTWGTAPTMSLVEGNWYVYTFENAENVKVIFKDSSGRQVPGQSEPGFFVEETGWYDGTKWLDADPFEKGPIEPATAPKNVSVANVTETTVALEWDESDGYVVRYEILRDGNPVGNTTTTTFTDTDLDSDTTYTYTVVAEGDAGQKSDPSVAIEITTKAATERNFVTVYYKNGFNTPYMHYRPEGGEWTTVPGIKMENAEIAGYSKLTVDIGKASKLEVAFNNGRGTWDSNNERNYLFIPGDNTYIPSHNGSAGEVIQGKPEEGNKVTIYYKNGFITPYVHYRPEGGTWTTLPGLKMNDSEFTGYSKLAIDIGEASRAEVAFNNGDGSWDSNRMNNYFFEIGNNTYIPGNNGSEGSVELGKPNVGITLAPVIRNLSVYVAAK